MNEYSHFEMAVFFIPRVRTSPLKVFVAPLSPLIRYTVEQRTGGEDEVAYCLWG